MFPSHDQLWRNLGCTKCAHIIFSKKPADGDLLLPWKDEYDDLETFDPEGVLVSDVEEKPTPVLDWLRQRSMWNTGWDSQELERALYKHREVYGNV